MLISRTAESSLNLLPAYNTNKKIFGPVEFLPGELFSRLLYAANQGRLAGAVGVAFTRTSVAAYNAELRAKIGMILQLIPRDRFYVWDELSVQWAQHYSVNARLGGDPRWLYAGEWECSPDTEPVAMVSSVADAFAAATRGEPFVAIPQTTGALADGPDNNLWEKTLVRWVQRWVGHTDCVIRPDEEPDRERAVRIPLSSVERYRAEAKDTLADILREKRRKGNVVKLASKMGRPVPPPEDEKARVFKGVMDPATHYDDHYYGVDGKYILYPKPDGSWETYRGPAHHWEGNRTIARIVDRMFKRDAVTKLLDVGCGAGDFVQKMVDLDWDAVGTDISAAAQAHSTCPDKIIVGDIVEFAREETLDATYDVVTAFDFWEHVYERDVDDLARAVLKALKPGGTHVACICTHGLGERDQVFEPGQKITPENAWCLVSGHVNVRAWGYWIKKFKQLGFELHHAAMTMFNVQRDQDPSLRNVGSWSARNIVICRKPRT